MSSSGHDTAITNTMSQQLWQPALGLHKAVMDQGGAYEALLPSELVDIDGT